MISIWKMNGGVAVRAAQRLQGPFMLQSSRQTIASRPTSAMSPI